MTGPPVSVVIPVRNGADFLADAVRGALAESYTPTEVIVVDDGSTDGSGELARSLGATVLTRAHAGAPAARNAGIRASSGSLIAFADADDPWVAGRLERQVERLLEESELGFVVGRSVRFVEPGVEPPPDAARSTWHEPAEGYLATALIRRELFDTVGYLDESLPICDDIDWVRRAQSRGIRHAVMDDLVFPYRYHGANLTSDRAALRRDVFAVLRLRAAAQRAAE